MSFDALHWFGCSLLAFIAIATGAPHRRRRAIYCAWCGVATNYPHALDCPNADRYVTDDDYDIQARRRYCEITGMARQECDCDFCRRWIS